MTPTELKHSFVFSKYHNYICRRNWRVNWLCICPSFSSSWQNFLFTSLLLQGGAWGTSCITLPFCVLFWRGSCMENFCFSSLRVMSGKSFPWHCVYACCPVRWVNWLTKVAACMMRLDCYSLTSTLRWYSCWLSAKFYEVTVTQLKWKFPEAGRQLAYPAFSSTRNWNMQSDLLLIVLV